MLGVETTNIHPMGLAFTLLMGALLIFLPRRLATIPIFMTACFIPFGQRIIIADLNLYLLRIVIFLGWVRLILHKEIFTIKLNAVDKAILCWVISNIIIFTALRQSSGALINRLGFAYNVVGLYFLFRFLIKDFSDINNVFKLLAIISVLLVFPILYEYITGKNLFSIFGGVQKEFEITQIRRGRLRCMGPFRTPILTGTFGALMVPLSVALWYKGRSTRLLAVVVFLGGTFITMASGSNGPIMTYLCGVICLLMWHFRMHMKAVWSGLFLVLIALHLYMTAPVWFLTARLGGLFGTSTGWHRSILIDKAIKHFDEWWLLGTDYTVHWTGRSISPDPNMADITNEFIRQGVNGGLLTMVLFIIIIGLCFRSIGKALRLTENQLFATRITLWSMGTMLFAHVVTFTSVAYIDQMIVFWYALLAMISTSVDVSKTILDKAGSTTIGLQDD